MTSKFLKDCRRISYLLIAVLLITLSCSTGAQTAASKQMTAEIDKILSGQFKAGETGCAALVAKNGQIIYKKAFGLANLELNVPMQPDMVFRIGSITKQFTAIAILQLMEQGKLALSDEITKFVPDYPTLAYKITIEHLLTHTSGIRSYTSITEFQKFMRTDMKPEEVINLFKNQPMDFAPGTKWAYNNSGYFLLGYIIEKISGKTYPEYIRDNFFIPLGMTNSLYGSDSKIVMNRAWGYMPDGDGVKNADMMSMSLPYAAGSIQSTVEDLFKWHQAVHLYKLVKKETLEKAFREYKLSDGKGTKYGYGWFLSQIQGSPTIEHGGGINGYLTSSVYLPDQDVFVALFSNNNAKAPALSSNLMAAIAIGKPYNRTEVTLEEAVLEQYKGVYENEDGILREISKDGKQLFSQRKNAERLAIKASGKDNFFYDNSLTILTFRRDANGNVTDIVMDDRGTVTIWKRTNKSFDTRKELKVPESVLAQYTGDYELQPGFILTVTKEGDRLFTQATGQAKIEVFAESETKFYLKVVTASIEFVKDAGGKVTKLFLDQGGRKMEALKIK